MTSAEQLRYELAQLRAELVEKVTRVRRMRDRQLGGGRELSLAVTKLEEALFWSERARAELDGEPELRPPVVQTCHHGEPFGACRRCDEARDEHLAAIGRLDPSG